jgi:hypothetical protein
MAKPADQVAETAIARFAGATECECGRSAELCLDDVAPVLSRVVGSGLSHRDSPARTALERVARPKMIRSFVNWRFRRLRDALEMRFQAATISSDAPRPRRSNAARAH